MFKKLKGLFVEEDPNGSNSTASADQDVKKVDSSKTSTDTVQTIGVQPTFDPATIEGKAPDQKFLDVLLKAIESNNMEGFDYLEYKSSLQSLSKVNMDDATRYQSAMAMSKTMGASTEKILSSANHYLSILKAENDKFLQAVNGQKSKISSDQSEGLKNIELSIQNKQKQIDQLNKEIESEKAAMKKMKDDITNSTNKIAETTAKFNQAYKIVSQQIMDDIKNINNYAAKL
jgi:hypothetical protein